MVQKNQSKQELVLVITHYTDNYGTEKYGHTTAHVAHWDAAFGRPCGRDNYGQIPSGFRATSQYDNAHSTGSYGHTWGIQPVFHSVVTADEFLQAASFVRTTEKRYDKLVEQFGPPTTLGAYLVYLASALGIKKACWKTSADRWHIGDAAGDLRYHVDEFIATWHETHGTTKGTQLDTVA